MESSIIETTVASLPRVETIGERIKRLRESKGLSRSDLAYKINISPQGMAALENGETKIPSFPVGLKLSRALGVSPWEIAFGERSERPEEERDSIEADLAALLAPFAPEERNALLAGITATETVTPLEEERLARLERYAAVHHRVLNHLVQTSLVTDRLPELLERLAHLVPGSETLVAELRTLREST